MEKRFFAVIIKWYSTDSWDEGEHINYGIHCGTSFADVAQQIVDDWGDDVVVGMTIVEVGTDGGQSILISDSLFEALIEDDPEKIVCTPSDWRKEKLEKKANDAATNIFEEASTYE